jgi:hypothetical protein
LAGSKHEKHGNLLWQWFAVSTHATSIDSLHPFIQFR